MKTCKTCLIPKELKDFHTEKHNGVTFYRHECRVCRNAYRKSLSTRGGEGLRRKCLLRKYGLTVEDYDQMLKDQNGVCKICKELPKARWGFKLAVDHCHSTGKVRGLLCDKCNKGLGQFMDDVALLMSAIEYLKA